MKELIEKLKYNYRNGDVSIKLIFICVSVFLISSLLNFLIFRRNGINIDDFFGAQAGFEGFLRQPWGIVTYLFFHGGLLHLLLNMLMIYFIGQMFLRYFRTADFLTFFFFGAISGAIAFILFSNLLNYQNSILIGASAAVYSIFFGLVSYVPKTKVQLFLINVNIPLDYVGIGLVVFDVLMIFNGNNTGGHISHLGGAAFGFLYMKQFEKGNDFFGKIIGSIFSKPVKMKKTTNPSPPKDDYEFNGEKLKKQQQIDKILDKISKSGYESLSKEEKDILFKAGGNG